MTSFSKFTTSPTLFESKVVTSLVCGINETEKFSSVTSATVRLMPSMAIEPFSTISSRISLFAEIVTHTAFCSRFMEMILPVPSMCPETICPPSLEPTAAALSRLTLEPE